MPPFDQLVDRVSAALWNLYPSRAVRLGMHEYDGVVPDLTAAALSDGYERLRRLRRQVAEATGLAAGQEMDRAVLLAALDGEILTDDLHRRWQRCPAAYLEPLDVGPYLGRDYAPAGLRLEQATAVLQAVPETLAAARANLDPVIPRPAVGWAERRTRALAGALAAGPTVAGPTEAAEERWMRQEAAAAATELEAFAGWLETERLPTADDGFALGAQVVQQMLQEGEALGRSLPEIADLAGKTLAADQEAWEDEAGKEPGPTGSPPAAGEEWTAALRAAAGDARRFVVDAALVTVPDDIPLRVMGDSAPSGARVALDPPGPYDPPAAGAVLHAEGRRREAGEVDDLALAAVCPGRLLQSRRAAVAPSEAARRFCSRGFRDGWALYAGQAMWEAGYRGGDPAWRRVWLARAQRAGCRVLCTIAMQAGEMTPEQAEGCFVEWAHCSRETARGEAERVAADPGSLAAGLGRLEILDVRRRWQDRHPGAPLGRFHDALLGRGAPPLGLLDRVVLP